MSLILLLLLFVVGVAFAGPRSPRFSVRVEGGQHTLAIDAAGQVWAWGSNSAGQLGSGSFRPEDKPVAVSGLKKIVAVAAGRRHSLALGTDGRVWAWGAGQFGQTGNGSSDHFASQPLPGLVPLPVAIQAIAAGDHHTLARGVDGSVWAWGANDLGQLGDGGKLDSARPVKVKLKEPVEKIFAQGGRSGAVALDGNILSWGGVQQGRAEVLARKVSRQAAWFRKDLPPATVEALPALPAAPKATASVNAPTPPVSAKVLLPTASLKAAAQASVAPALSVPAPLPAMPAPVTSVLPSARPVSGAASSLPASREPVRVRGRVFMQGVGLSQGLAGVEVKAGNTDCAPTDNEGWFECRVSAGWSGTLRPRKAKYRFAPSSVSLDLVQADMDSQQYFTAVYEPF
ncbi:MAG: hypothetical protein A2505_10980 [Deltaproteobacteria bacterium RIFOXYD12_FULL_55_16]|nr:MAG: hypothetical protein A2505_10980 [Deltaproteobacteria bacterium RIFOXYD12_FULL_55_16]